MTIATLVVKNLRRNLRRTVLTILSVSAALFLFCALTGVLDTLEDSIKVGSEARLIVRNAISLIFDLPESYAQDLRNTRGVKRVTISNWFGGQDPKDPRNFFPNFGVEADTYLPMYKKELRIVEADPAPPGVTVPEGVDPKLAAFMAEQTACVVGDKLMKKMGWKLGQTITLKGTIYPGNWEFVIRAVYTPTEKAFGDEALFFHWKYLDQKTAGEAQAGIYILELENPASAAAVAKQVDANFESSPAATRTETERAFQAGFVNMYGNLPFVLRIIGFAVVFAILLVSANTMMMAIRERTGELAVMKTLGFQTSTLFSLILFEAVLITLVGGGLGALGAKFLIEATGFNAGGALPPMSVHWSTVGVALTIAAFLGAVSGIMPAVRAVRLKIVDALRRVE